jgi:hypothetical protein
VAWGDGGATVGSHAVGEGRRGLGPTVGGRVAPAANRQQRRGSGDATRGRRRRKGGLVQGGPSPMNSDTFIYSKKFKWLKWN